MVSFLGFLRWSGWEASGLVVPGGVEDELADQLAGVASDDSDVQVVDEQGDVGAAGGGAEADVVELAVVDSASCHDMAVRPAMQAGDHEKHEHASGAQSMNKDIPPWSGFTAAVSRHPVWNEHDQAESS